MDACYNLMGEWRQLKCHNISVGGFKTGPWRLYRRNWEKPFSSSCIWYVCVFWVWERDRRREREEEEGKKGRGEKVLMNSPTFSCHLQLQAFLFILLFFQLELSVVSTQSPQWSSLLLSRLGLLRIATGRTLTQGTMGSLIKKVLRTTWHRILDYVSWFGGRFQGNGKLVEIKCCQEVREFVLLSIFVNFILKNGGMK